MEPKYSVSKRVVVPSQAVQSGQQGQYVFVMKPDKTVDFRPVKVARTVAGEAVIAQGIQAGEQVVTDGQLRLFDKARVDITTGLGAGSQSAVP